jgi:hypothetical protein
MSKLTSESVLGQKKNYYSPFSTQVSQRALGRDSDWSKTLELHREPREEVDEDVEGLELGLGSGRRLKKKKGSRSAYHPSSRVTKNPETGLKGRGYR